MASINNFYFRLEHYGIGPKYSEAPGFFESVTAGAAAAASGTSDVNLVQIAGNAVNVGAGAADTGTLRVILASDSPGIGAHDDPTADAGYRELLVATTADPAAVADQDDVHGIADTFGRRIIAGYNRAGDHLDTALVAESLGLGEHDVATEADGMRALGVATDVDPAAVANQDDAHLITDLYGRLILAGYARLGDLIRIQETDPINLFIAHDLIQESAMGTTGSPYVYYIDLDGYYRMSHQIAITLGTATAGDVEYRIYGTVEDDDPDLTARTYIDRTTAISGGPTITVDSLIEDINGIHGNYTAVKLEVTVVNAANDSAIRIDTKRFIGG